MQIGREESGFEILICFALLVGFLFLAFLNAGFDNYVVHGVLMFFLPVSIVFILKNSRRVRFNSIIIWYGFFVLWSGISFVYSVNLHRSLVEFLQLVLFGIVLFLTSQVKKENIIKIGRLAIFAVVAIAFLGILQYLFLSSSRITSTFDNPNPLGIFFVMTFICLWGYYILTKSKVSFCANVILLVAIFLTGSRGSVIALGLGLVAFIIMSKKLMVNKKEGYCVAYNVIPIFVCFAISLILTWSIMATAPKLQETRREQDTVVNFLVRPESFISSSGAGRLEFWKVGYRVGISRPITGYGLGTYNLSYPLGYDGNRWFSRYAHNHYIQIFAELGVVGVVLFLFFVFSVLKMGFKSIKNGEDFFIKIGLFSAIVAFIIYIGGDFSFNFPAVSFMFFGIVGVLTGEIKSETKSVNAKNRYFELGLVLLMIGVFILSIWQFWAYQMYKRALGLEREGMTIEALDTYSFVNRVYPINSMAFSFQSNSLRALAMKNNDEDLLEEALEYSKRAVALSRLDANAHNDLGNLYWQLGKKLEAEYHLKKATKYSLYRLKMYMDLGFFYIKQQEYDKARIVLLEGIELKDAALDSARRKEDVNRVEGEVEILEVFMGSIENSEE